ncbi:MAG: GNAT family N-acetyltransferase [Anaerolineales bacterium]
MPLTITQIDTADRRQVRRFVDFHYRLYAGQPNWTPPFRTDIALMLNKQKHPFYEHSDADFFLAERDGQVVGRIAALENRPFNRYHGTRQAAFYLFDCIDDQQVAAALFERVFEWARARGLNALVGPKGFGPLDGYGILVEGYQHRQMMNMMNYNFPYYPHLLEALGFEKEVDFVSCYLSAEKFTLDPRIYRIAQRARQRSNLEVVTFENKRQLRAWANRIGQTYNKAFVNNWEYVPLTEREIKFVLDNILLVANPRLIKVIAHQGDAVGFLFGFPDVSAAMQRANGHLYPWNILDLVRELRRTTWIALNGAGILPEYHGRGGNALLYTEMEKTIKSQGFHFRHADLTQVAESAFEMRHDLQNVGGQEYKNHRVFRKALH